MFDRLINNKFPSTMLNVSYRLHPALLEVPNILCYDNKIKDGYYWDNKNKFLHKDHPFLFINVKGKCQKSGTSFFNAEEAEIATKFLVHLMNNQ